MSGWGPDVHAIVGERSGVCTLVFYFLTKFCSKSFWPNFLTKKLTDKNFVNQTFPINICSPNLFQQKLFWQNVPPFLAKYFPTKILSTKFVLRKIFRPNFSKNKLPIQFFSTRLFQQKFSRPNFSNKNYFDKMLPPTFFGHNFPTIFLAKMSNKHSLEKKFQQKFSWHSIFQHKYSPTKKSDQIQYRLKIF